MTNNSTEEERGKNRWLNEADLNQGMRSQGGQTRKNTFIDYKRSKGKANLAKGGGLSGEQKLAVLYGKDTKFRGRKRPTMYTDAPQSGRKLHLIPNYDLPDIGKAGGGRSTYGKAEDLASHLTFRRDINP